MTKPNMVNPQNFSVEALDRVSEFYKQSFEQLSQFYTESFSQLLWTVGAVGTVVAILVGVIGPLFVGFYQKKILKKDRNEMEKSIKEAREELEGAINKIKEEYEKKLEENLKKFKGDFEKMEADLRKEIGVAEVRGFQLQAAGHYEPVASILLNSLALSTCLEKRLEISYVCSVMDDIRKGLKKSDKVSEDAFLRKDLPEQIEKLKNHEKENSLFQDKVNELEEEFKKALERTK